MDGMMSRTDEHILQMGYPLVNIQKAIENGDRNSGFSQLLNMVDLSLVFC
jgi:hypothetical protein